MRGTGAILVAFLLACTPATALADTPELAPLDPQDPSWQDDMTWSDYKPLPGRDYSDPAIQPSVKKWKVALVLVDFPDRDFIVSQPAGGTIWGTPTAQANSVPRAEVPRFYARLPQHAPAAQQPPDHEPVLDGEHVRQVRRRAGPVRPVPDAVPRVSVLRVGVRLGGALPDAGRDAVQQEHPHGRARGVARRRRPRRHQLLRQHLLRCRRAGPELDLAGVRRDALDGPRAGAGRVRAEGLRPVDPRQLEHDALRPLELVGDVDQHLAERRHLWGAAAELDRGRELGHGHLRPRADAQPRHPRQLQQPVRHDAAAGGDRATGT